jgi:hypothetical protein
MPASAEIILHRGGGEQRGRAEQIVPAAMPVPARLQFLRLGDAGNLRQPGQRIVLAEDRDHRTAVAGFAHHGGRYPATRSVIRNPSCSSIARCSAAERISP